eukprot:TRINITY_DN37239_c1_g1_i1.p1 TRINITY_DN37239_c1_g1~~TRINITY_DN37239_c1_g1_i1.p1  ORF type:complete len:319 (+),score=16.11 TRINITY_DN37239_c1_g1_i1:28-984(+)
MPLSSYNTCSLKNHLRRRTLLCNSIKLYPSQPTSTTLVPLEKKLNLKTVFKQHLTEFALVSLLLTAPPSFAVENLTILSPDNPLADVAKIVASERRPIINQNLFDLERETGWKLRIATKQSQEQFQSSDLRSAWINEVGDKRIAIIQVDVSSPNILKWDYIGDDFISEGGPLRRPFWIELQSRFGNMFYVREEGESAVVDNVVESLSTCLRRPDGCRVVPGLPQNQYIFTLIVSVAGGLICGFVSRLEPQGFIKQRWVWVLLFSPLWGSLFVSFGLGPIVSRTDDVLPLVGNTSAFLLTVLVFQLVRGAPLFPPEEQQ